MMIRRREREVKFNKLFVFALKTHKTFFIPSLQMLNDVKSDHFFIGDQHSILLFK